MTVSIQQKDSDTSGQQDPSFWGLIKKAKDGRASASDALREHPRVAKMILVICICLMRGKPPWEYRDIENLQEAVGRRLKRDITSFAGNSESDFSEWLWELARRQLDEQARDERLSAWWGGLSARQRRIVRLHADGHDLAEIGKLLPGSKSESQVRRDLTSALKRLELITSGWQKSDSAQAAGRGLTKGGKIWARKVKKRRLKPS